MLEEARIPQDSPDTIYNLMKDLRERESNLQDKEDSLKKPVIDKSTAVSIGFVTTIAAVVWLISGLYTDVQASKEKINKIEEALVKINDVQVQISSISTKLDSLQGQIDKIK